MWKKISDEADKRFRTRLFAIQKNIAKNALTLLKRIRLSKDSFFSNEQRDDKEADWIKKVAKET